MRLDLIVGAVIDSGPIKGNKLQLRLLEFFILEVTARSAANVLDLQANTAALFFRKVRELIAEQVAADEELLGGGVKADESYFGGVRKGKRGRGAAGKVSVFGRLKRGGQVFVQRWLGKTEHL